MSAAARVQRPDCERLQYFERSLTISEVFVNGFSYLCTTQIGNYAYNQKIVVVKG